MPKQRLDFKTFILLLLSSCFVIELSVKVLACVETKAGPFLILHYDLSAVLGDLFWVGGGVYSINFSNIFKTMFDFQGQRIEKRWAKEAEVRIQCQTCSETRSLASERQKMDTVRDRRRRVERDGEQEFEKLSKTKRGKREMRREGWTRGCTVLRLRWDWDSAEDQRHHCDSAGFGAEPTLWCATGSIRRDEEKRGVKEHKITLLPRAWKEGGGGLECTVQTMK